MEFVRSPREFNALLKQLWELVRTSLLTCMGAVFSKVSQSAVGRDVTSPSEYEKAQ